MGKIYKSAADLIGNTPLVEVGHIEEKFGLKARVLVKLEYFNATGSVSASEFIETMLSYFERNGVDPRTSINGKFKTLKAILRHILTS